MVVLVLGAELDVFLVVIEDEFGVVLVNFFDEVEDFIEDVVVGLSVVVEL